MNHHDELKKWIEEHPEAFSKEEEALFKKMRDSLRRLKDVGFTVVYNVRPDKRW